MQRVQTALIWIGISLTLSAPCVRAAAADDDAIQFFESRIRPLLADNCLGCHGDNAARGGVRLDSRSGILGGAQGPVAVVGHPEQSRLIQAVLYGGPVKMPPAGKLEPAQIGDLTTWVREGLPWPETPKAAVSASKVGKAPPASRTVLSTFWSFQKVKKPAIPTVRKSAWPITPIDRFILARLEKAGLQPAPRSDRRMLLRRATLDLTGLPPTPEEMREFLIDRSSTAFARVVDRLLASPRYGERWGRYWLDIVRYCDSLDTRSLGSDGDISEAWRYRDWVVEAFNCDLPYNQFIIDQIAGDLLPVPQRSPPRGGEMRRASYLTGTDSAADTPLYLRGAGDVNARGIVATGMLAIGNWGNGDADKEKILTDIADDQVDVVCRGFMGLTVGCARCHDHKFDPIPTRDYYGLAGIFFSTHILPGLAAKGSGENILKVPLLSAAEMERRSDAANRTAALQKAIAALTEQVASQQARSLLAHTADYLCAAWELRKSESQELDRFAAAHGLQPAALRRWTDYLFGGGYRLMKTPVRDVLANGGVHAWKGDSDTPSVTVNTNDSPRTILTFTLPPRSLSVHPGPANGVVVAWKSPITGVVRVTGSVADADPACGDGIAWAIDKRELIGYREIASGGFPNGGSQSFSEGAGAAGLSAIPVKPGEMIQLLVLPRANYACDTTVVHFSIVEQGGGHRWDATTDVLDSLHEGGNPHPDRYQNPGVWQFLDMAGSGRFRAGDAVGTGPREQWLSSVSTAHTAAEVAAASRLFAKTFTSVDASSPFWTTDTSTFPPQQRAAIESDRAELKDALHETASPVVYANAAQDGGVPGSPQAGFHDVRVHIRGSYLRLGDVAPRHFPLVLGGGLQPPIRSGSGRLELARWVASPDNPLTARVIANRIWQHHFGDGIVRTPGNFGKLGERPTHPELLDYLADQLVKGGWSIKKLQRMIMLSAVYQQSSLSPVESVRKDPDNRLFGRMNRQRLDAEAIRDSFLTVTGRLDPRMGGPAVRELESPRRTIYLMTIRSDRSGYRTLFDAADPTSLVDRRTVSTVAPQALFLMNSDFARSAARVLAARLVRDMGRDDIGRIHRAYQLLYGRPATLDELAIGRAYLARARRSLAADTAEGLDDRVWQAYSQILLCANEFIYVD